MDSEQKKIYYASLDDKRLEHLIKHQAWGLEQEVFQFLIDEVGSRGLNSDILYHLNIRKNRLSETEMNEIKTKIINLPCPECNQKDSQLEGNIVRLVISIVVFTHHEKRTEIKCKTCARKNNRSALASTLFLGWWGIPHGIIKTPIALVNSIIERQKHEKVSDSIITDFIKYNIGDILINWKDEDGLSAMVKNFNESNRK